MAERPILFSGPMVRAVLAGTKTQTRRVVKPQRVHGWDPAPPTPGAIPKGRWSWRFGDTHQRVHQDCPFGVPGDRLWVRETWAPVSPHEGEAPLEECRIEYRADVPERHLPGGWHNAEPGDPDIIRWRPSIHMPRWASRITLEITEVRVQRLQDITEEDARAEGVKASSVPGDLNHRGRFRQLWDDLYAVPEIPSPTAAKKRPGYSWADNPWVWAVTYKPVPMLKAQNGEGAPCSG